MKDLLAVFESMTYDEAVERANSLAEIAKLMPPAVIAMGFKSPTADELWDLRNKSIKKFRKKIAKLEAA
jgi:hypothetical protein